MPRIQTTRTVKIALFALASIWSMLLLILFAFVPPPSTKRSTRASAPASLSRQFRQPVRDRVQPSQLGPTLDVVADELRIVGAVAGLDHPSAKLRNRRLRRLQLRDAPLAAPSAPRRGTGRDRCGERPASSAVGQRFELCGGPRGLFGQFGLQLAQGQIRRRRFAPPTPPRSPSPPQRPPPPAASQSSPLAVSPLAVSQLLRFTLSFLSRFRLRNRSRPPSREPPYPRSPRAAPSMSPSSDAAARWCAASCRAASLGESVSRAARAARCSNCSSHACCSAALIFATRSNSA